MGPSFLYGKEAPVRVCVVNDREDGNGLPASGLDWALVGKEGRVLVSVLFLCLLWSMEERQWWSRGSRSRRRCLRSGRKLNWCFPEGGQGYFVRE